MSVFSKQKSFCKACGAELFRILASPGYNDLCNTTCAAEWEWRYSLSVVGKEYYPRYMAPKGKVQEGADDGN